jgi:hypothetical protein
MRWREARQLFRYIEDNKELFSIKEFIKRYKLIITERVPSKMT